MNGARLYWRFISASVKSQMQYRWSILLQTIGTLLVTAIEFFGVYALFSRFGSLKGWTLPEAALFYGFINTAFSLADACTRGFDTLSTHVRMGTFDRYLLRPVSTGLQVFGSEFTLRRAGRFIQGAGVFVWGWLQLRPDTAGAAVIAFALPSAAALFSGIIIISGAVTFWTVESMEAMNILTYGGVQTGMYPLDVYRKWLSCFFIFFVPIGLVSYFPICAVLHRSPFNGIPFWVGYITPAAGPLFFFVALIIWRSGVRHYSSTGT
ncbi:MAG: ABC-2 family transporter protein [Spirochaetales bacterium]|nr:ABC-2 family transporter protein [Spirochaetales bacterium]